MTSSFFQPLSDLSRHRRFSVLLIAAVLQLGTTSSFAVDTAKKTDTELSHGPREFLIHSLLQSPEDARLVASAERHLSLGEYVPSFEALLAVFSREHGQFSPVFRGKPITETHQAGLQLLLSAPYSARRAWAETVEPDAAIALKSAAQAGDRYAYFKVARRYPLTPSGFRALSITAAAAWRSGQRHIATSILAEMEATYAATRLSFPVEGAIQLIRQRIQEEGIRTPKAKVASIPVQNEISEPGLPGAAPLWTWQQELWKTPQIVPSTVVLNLPVGRSDLAQSVWKPAFRKNDIVLRTPTQVKCFRKTTGKELWSIATDTLAADFSTTPEAGYELVSQLSKGNSATSHADLIQMDDFGTVTATDDLVIFVDHFRRLRSDVEARQRINFRNRLDVNLLLTNTRDGSRLVCLTTKPKPRVLWTVGDAPEFSYSVQSGSEEMTFDSTSSDELSPFAGQRFLGPPLAHDRQLFLLSTDDERVWLNCLAQGSGRLEWKTPISFHDADERQSRQLYLRIAEKIHGASLCGITGDTLVSALNNGLVVGTRIYDGHLLWATNFRDAALGDNPRNLRQGLSAYINARSTGGTFRPLLKHGKLVWSAPRSLNVRCADANTGELAWSVSREAEGLGTLEGSADQYAVATEGDQVLLVGERHLRSISLKDGKQIWVAPLSQQSGRAFCASGTCIVPCMDGSLRSFDVATGQQIAATRETSLPFTGTYFMDDDVVCASTPVSLQIFPSISFERYESVPGLSDLETQFRESSFQLRSGQLEAGLASLHRLWQNPKLSSDPQMRQKVRAVMMDVVRDRAMHAKQDHDDLQWIDDLELTPAESLGLSLLAGFEGLSAKKDHDSFLEADTTERLSITRGWSVRSDVAALSVQAEVARRIASDGTSLSELDIERALLNPRLVGEEAAQLSFARELIKRNDFAAAEMFLMTAVGSASKPEQHSLATVLAELRGIRSSSGHSSASSPRKPKFKFSETSDLHNSLPSLIRAKPQVVSKPDWFQHRLLLAGTKLHTVSNETGAVSVPVSLPAGASPEPVDFRDNRPSLLPISGIDRCGVLSLADGRTPKQLWWKEVGRDETDLSPVTVGPFGPNYMIVATGASLQCFHPLTGNVLWKRRFFPAEISRNTFYSSITIVGDSEVTAVLGEHLGSCTTFDTATGRERGDIRLHMTGRQTPLVSGRRLLYVNGEQLVLQDLRDGTDLLAGNSEIAIAPNGRAQLLSKQLAGVITAEGSFVVLDMQSGAVRIKCPIGDDVDLSQMTGMRILERSGRFYVMVKTNAPMRYGLSNSSAVGDDRVDYGTLLAVNATTGKLLWSRKSTAAVMPEVFGDPSPFLVLWSRKNDFTTRRLGASYSETASVVSQLTVIDRNSGETLVADQPFSVSDLLRCSHDAEARELIIRTERSVIRATYR